jgi:hypothetical protein
MAVDPVDGLEALELQLQSTERHDSGCCCCRRDMVVVVVVVVCCNYMYC